ncbi:MAG: trypsin-like peptidase domain-containing protein [Verrucomicrobiales bacterium]
MTFIGAGVAAIDFAGGGFYTVPFPFPALAGAEPPTLPPKLIRLRPAMMKCPSRALMTAFLVPALMWAADSRAQNAAPAPAAVPATALPAGVADVPSAAEQADVSQIEFGAVVRVEVDMLGANYRVPWNIGGTGSGVGTGFLVGKNQFLTNAHVISNARLIYIRKVDQPEPFPAKVLHVAHDCDLALLELIEPGDFKNFEKVTPLEIGGIPKLNTTVTAVGYPIGGDRISVTRGVVSRIDFRPYSHSAVDNHLTIQVDAAINPGNSGGPVLQDNKVVGVAFQGFSGAVAQNTAYMIPVPVVNRFLKDIQDGHYDNYVDLATSTIDLLNPAQRLALGLPNDGTGVMVVNADASSSAAKLLLTGDVLLAIDGHAIASDGFVEIEGERINLNEIVERKFAGDKVKIDIQREGTKKSIEVELRRFLPYLIQANLYEQKPQFVLFAGLQFQPLDRNMMEVFNIASMDVRYFFANYGDHELYRERPQVVVLTAVLPDEINTYLEGYVSHVVDSVNGQKIQRLQDIYDALKDGVAEKGHENFHVIRLLNEGRPLVLERNKAAEAHARILRKYNVSFDHYIEVPLIEQVMGKMPPIKEESPEAGKEAKPDDKADAPNGKPPGAAKPE